MDNTAIATKKWKLDTNHTSLGFKVKHLGLAYIRGLFNEYEGEISLEEDSFQNSNISLTIFTDSINTGNDMRDNHLKTAEFFDVFAFPEMKFKSSSVKKNGENIYEIEGALTIRDITKTITLQATHPGITNDMYGNTVAIFHITGEIDRTEFGVAWHNLLENGLAVVGKKIEFDMNIELVSEE